MTTIRLRDALWCETCQLFYGQELPHPTVPACPKCGSAEHMLRVDTIWNRKEAAQGVCLGCLAWKTELENRKQREEIRGNVGER